MNPCGGTPVRPEDVGLPQANYLFPFPQADCPRVVVDRVERLLDLPRHSGPVGASCHGAVRTARRRRPTIWFGWNWAATGGVICRARPVANR